jgi:hypothetical protein
MAYILERYGTTSERQERLRLLWRETERLEIKIFEGLAMAPEEIDRLLGPDGLAAAMHEFAVCAADTAQRPSKKTEDGNPEFTLPAFD